MKYREATRHMNFRQKLQYIADYYKLPLFLLALVFCLLLAGIYHTLTRKNTCLSIAFINVQISDDTLESLTAPFLKTQPGGQSKNTIAVERSLLSGSTAADSGNSREAGDGSMYEYSYASQMKLLAMITAKKLDLVIMDAETADVFCRQGYIDRAVSLENTTFFRDAGLNQPVYAGILQNTPHKDSSEAFLKLLLQ